MSEVITVHDTVVVSRSLNAPAERVFALWSEASALERWYVPGDDSWSGFAMTVMQAGEPITTSMVTVEIEPRDGGSELRVTDQLVLLNDGDTVEARRGGWGEVVDKLVRELAG